MTFTSVVFLLFLPTVFCLYWLLRTPRLQNPLLVAASYFFYGWWDYRFCFLMLSSSLVDYGIGMALARTEAARRRKFFLLLSIGCNLSLLGVFKYFHFFTDSFRQLGAIFGFDMATGTFEILLPVGISFYTFQTLSYTIDIYRRRIEPTKNLVDYLAFVSFFPQLVAGPIERAATLLPQFQQARTFRWDEIQCGARRILWGFFKKIVLADTLAQWVMVAYAEPSAASGPHLMLATVLFAFQIYCDFSAYSDIAIGTARMFDIRLMRNFAYPYFSQSVAEFWQRWHISLSTWFRDYVYIPLGGNRTSRSQRNRNIVLTFLVSGLWHGAAWRFVAWGALHGAASIGLRLKGKEATAGETLSKATFEIDRPGGSRVVPSLGIVLRMLVTFAVVCLLWVFFRAESIGDAVTVCRKMAVEVFYVGAYQQLILEYTAGGALFYSLNLLAAFILVEWIGRHKSYPLEINWPRPLRWVAYTTVFWFVAEYAEKTPSSPFIYFQF